MDVSIKMQMKLVYNSISLFFFIFFLLKDKIRSRYRGSCVLSLARPVSIYFLFSNTSTSNICRILCFSLSTFVPIHTYLIFGFSGLVLWFSWWIFGVSERNYKNPFLVLCFEFRPTNLGSLTSWFFVLTVWRTDFINFLRRIR